MKQMHNTERRAMAILHWFEMCFRKEASPQSVPQQVLWQVRVVTRLIPVEACTGDRVPGL